MSSQILMQERASEKCPSSPRANDFESGPDAMQRSESSLHETEYSEKTLLSSRSSTSSDTDVDIDVERGLLPRLSDESSHRNPNSIVPQHRRPRPTTPGQKKTERKPLLYHLTTAFYLLLNAASSIAIVFLNKRIFLSPALQATPSLLALFHLLTTATLLSLTTLPPIRLFRPRLLPTAPLLPLSVLSTAFLTLNNFSLTLNSTPFYQLAKHMTVPTVVLYEYLLPSGSGSGSGSGSSSGSGSLPSPATAVALAYITAGVALTNFRDIQLNLAGTLVAIAAFAATAGYQVCIKRSLERLFPSSSSSSTPTTSTPSDNSKGTKSVDASSLSGSANLLLNQIPLTSVMLAVAAPFTDDVSGLARWLFNPSSHNTSSSSGTSLGLLVLTSGLVAAVLNLSQFLIIGRTGPLTFNVAGSFKTVVILLVSWFGRSGGGGGGLQVQEVVGVVLALGGTLAYSRLKLA